MQKILIIDDNEDVLLAAKLLLKRNNYDVTIEKNPLKIPFHLNNSTFDLILLDMNFSQDITSGKEGFQWLNKILEIDPNIVVVLITAFGDVEMAVKALKEGATDFVLKPWQNEKLLATISSALKLRESYKKLDSLKETNKVLLEKLDAPFKDIIGNSPSLKNIFKLIDKVAATDANILILGENGTGKELIARAIYKKSLRHANPFITVDMGSITESLFESELFGHKKGAYTDAKEDRPGRFEIADKGTIFLDEIGNLPLSLQSKLLTVLQKREVTRIGANKGVPIDIRLICATNASLDELASTQKFRQDLLYRINTIEIKLPPLRERGDDVIELGEYFTNHFCRKYNKPKKFLSKAAISVLKHYAWPGNIRELEHAIERAVIISEGLVLEEEDFYFLVDKPISQYIEDTSNLEEIEKTLVVKILNKHGGNISKAAKELGLTRASLYRRIQKYDI